MLSLIGHILDFIRYPQLTRIPRNIERPFSLLLQLTLLCLFTGISAGIVLSLLISTKLIPPIGPTLMDDGRVSPYMLVLGPLVLGPLGEEIVFRGQLRRLGASIFFVALIPGAILSLALGTYWAFVISPFIFLILYLIYRFNLAGSTTLKYQFWERIFPWHFHLSTICFALMHLANFERGLALLPLGILYTLPQLSVGLIFGYTRMNYGLKYSIALHAMYNFLPAVLLFLKY